jgi:hypothetical protein
MHFETKFSLGDAIYVVASSEAQCPDMACPRPGEGAWAAYGAGPANNGGEFEPLSVAAVLVTESDDPHESYDVYYSSAQAPDNFFPEMLCFAVFDEAEQTAENLNARRVPVPK